MPWPQYVAWFFGGVAAANCLPHLVAGVTGRPFPTPFASPPFKGLSSPVVNVAWGLCNLLAAYLLLVQVGPFDVRDWGAAGAVFVGFALMALQVARSLVRTQGARAEPGTTEEGAAGPFPTQPGETRDKGTNGTWEDS